MRNGWRRVTEDIMVLGALAFLSATTFDKTEVRMIAAFGAYLAGRELSALVPRKRLGYAWPEFVAAGALTMLVAVKCGHEAIAHYWSTIAVHTGAAAFEQHFAGMLK